MAGDGFVCHLSSEHIGLWPARGIETIGGKEAKVAQLEKKSYSFVGKAAEGDWKGRLREEEAELARLMSARDACSESVEGAVLSFPVADGQARYLVKSEVPLVLQHIALFDGYAIEPAMVSGLGLEDVRRQVERNAQYGCWRHVA